MLPIYYIVRYTSDRKYFVWLAVIAIFFFIAEFLKAYLAPVLDVMNMTERMQGYMQEEDTASKMSIIRFLIFFVFLLLASFNIDTIRIKVKYADFVLKLSFIYVFFFCIGNIHNIFFRFQFFLMIPVCVLISYLCFYIRIRSIRYAFKIFVILFSFVYMQNLITRDSHYIPYSNYLEYMFTDKPTYNQRSNYNPTHSPYDK